MIKYKQHKKIEMMTVVDEIVCDWCGKNFLIYDSSSDCTFPCGGTVKIDFGYGSRFDSATPEEWSGDICDDCFEGELKKHLRKKQR
jgi:hypothetical protein